MPAFRQVSKERFGEDKDDLLIHCFCGAEEYVRFTVLDEEDVSSEYIDLGVVHKGDSDYPMLLWITFSKIPVSWWFWRDRLKNLWDSFMGRKYSLSDTVLIDEEGAKVLRDWIDEMLEDRKDGGRNDAI